MRPRSLAAAGAAAVLALTLGLSGHAGASVTGKDRGRATTPDAARAALDRVETLLEGRGGEARGGDGREATLALRDLVVQRSDLTGEDRRRADALLARPTDGGADPQGDGYAAGTVPKRTCTPDVCVHWVETSADAVPVADNNGNEIPDFVDRVRAALNRVHATYVAAGYREPKPDGARGGDTRTDVYLVDVGSEGLYGYCTSDEPTVEGKYDYWAYCVLDNDYAEFPANTPTQNMQVTAAHEYFHAVQFGYDAFEDGWFMEATATWAEDEVYDGIDDNVSYLPYGQLGRKPEARNPLDTFNEEGLGQYGNWIFFRYLTERYRNSAGGMPTLVRSMWEYADAAPGGEDRVSSIAVNRALVKRGSGFGPQYAAFADANRRPRQTYDEGAQNDYPAAPLRFASVTLSPGDRKTGWRTKVLDHMTTATAQYRPSSRMGSRWKLRLHVDMANRGRGSRAMVTVYKTGGETSTSQVSLGRDGDGTKTVGFSRAGVKKVELTLVNASLRFRDCWSDENGPLFFTCYGDSRDDDLRQLHRAVAFR